MIRDHLSDWEIEELIIHSPEGQLGKSTSNQRRHLANCDSCRWHKERLQELLVLYREDALERTEALSRRQTTTASAPAGMRLAPAFIQYAAHLCFSGMGRLAFALVLLLAILVPSFVRRQREHHAAEIARDNLLLEQVDQEVNASVPYPLQSLTNLVVGNENSPE